MSSTFNNKGKVLRLSLAAVVLIMASLQFAQADTYLSGQHIEPAFEGWRPNPDGTFNMMFGYMNENWVEEPDAPVGENNFFSPGDPDRGQPTHFLPRRNRFTFEVTVPSDWGDRELVWTLNVNGEERRAYATLKEDYLVDNMVIASETGSLGAGTSSPESRANVPPVVTVQGDDIRTVRVGQPLTFRTNVADDGLPTPSNPVQEALEFARFAQSGSFGNDSEESEAGDEAEEEAEVSPLAAALANPDPATIQRMIMMRPPVRVTVGKTNGLFLSWNVYRGAGNVTFDPPQAKPWEDTRAGANSPWGALWTPPPAPEDGMHDVTVTFDEPGTYVLWGRADDGGLYHDDYITVNVTP